MAKKPKKKPRHGYRNSGGRATAARPAARASTAGRTRARRAEAPDVGTIVASIAGGGGGALLGGFLAGQDVMSPEAVAMAMTAGGAIGAYTMDGRARVAAHGVAAAGAGQLALSLMARRDTAKATTEAAKAAAARRAPSAPPGDGAPPNGVPARQGYGRAPLFNRVAHAASSVRNQLAYVDAFDDDGYDDAAFDLD